MFLNQSLIKNFYLCGSDKFIFNKLHLIFFNIPILIDSINFRKKYPKQFGEMYDSLNLNSQVRNIFYRKKFIN